MKTPLVNLTLRLAPELKEWLERQAAANHRSINSEVVVALEHYRKQQEEERAKAAL